MNAMQTAVVRNEGNDAYASGVDYEMYFKDREYNFNGSFVGSILDPYTGQTGLDFGTGARLELEKTIGTWRGNLIGRFEHDKLNLNDMGYIRDPDHLAWQWRLVRWYDSDGEDAFFTQGNTEFSIYKSWLYANRSFPDPGDSTQALWTYDNLHDRSRNMHFSGWWETRDGWSLWYGLWHDAEGTSKRETRFIDDTEEIRGPLMTTPEAYGAWAGVHTDHRKNLELDIEMNINRNSEGSTGYELDTSLEWVQNSRMHHVISLGFDKRHNDAQWVGNYDNTGGGIGDISFVFGELDQRVWDLTLRSSLLFSRDQSLELYAQPFLAVGDYGNARELATPDSYDLQNYSAEDFDITDFDFSYAAVNLNMVYRWEYAPGSTIYLVWTHNRNSYDYRGDPSRLSSFDNQFSTTPLFDNEPENRFMAKISYWFSL